jgi:hypothetical protein
MDIKRRVTVKLNGNIARYNTWPRVVQIRVRPTAGVSAAPQNHHPLPTPIFPAHLGFSMVTASVLPVNAKAPDIALFENIARALLFHPGWGRFVLQ